MKKILLTLAALCTTFMAISQTTLKGIVTTNKGETVIGANVLLANTYDGASTDTLGRFSFTTFEKGEKRLFVTFIGCDTFKTRVVLTGQRIDLDIKIKETANELNEVTISR
jgi:CarboxypepD_reg-like domain